MSRVLARGPHGGKAMESVAVLGFAGVFAVLLYGLSGMLFRPPAQT